jgi:hypothetical protein
MNENVPGKPPMSDKKLFAGRTLLIALSLFLVYLAVRGEMKSKGKKLGWFPNYDD